MKKYSGAALFLLCLQFLQSLTFGFVLGQGAGDSLANYSPKWSWDWLASHGGPGDEALSFLSLNNQDQCLAVGSFSGTLKRPRGMLNSDGDSSDFFVTRLDTSGRWQWLERGGAAGEDEGYAVVGDSNSGILVAGSVTSFAGERGLKTGFVTRYHANGELDWLWQLETDTVMSEARVEHIAVRGNGELFFVATFSGSIHVNGLTIKSRGWEDGLVGKLNHKGQLIWFRQLGGLGHDQIHSLFVDEKSTVSIAGSFTDTLYAMRGDGSWDFLVSAGAKDGFVISYSDTGSLKLHTRFGGASSDEATSLVGQGEMFWLGGYFHGNANFGSQEVQSRGEEDLFLASVDSKGQWQQVFSAGSVSNDRILSMAFSPKAKMFWILGQAGSGAILGEDTLKSAGKTDYFLIPCNTDGHCSSLKQFGFGTASPNGEEIITLAADSKGSAYLGGRFRYRLALLKPPKQSKGGWDFFIGKVTPWPWPKIKNELQKK